MSMTSERIFSPPITATKTELEKAGYFFRRRPWGHCVRSHRARQLGLDSHKNKLLLDFWVLSVMAQCLTGHSKHKHVSCHRVLTFTLGCPPPRLPESHLRVLCCWHGQGHCQETVPEWLRPVKRRGCLGPRVLPGHR